MKWVDIEGFESGVVIAMRSAHRQVSEYGDVRAIYKTTPLRILKPCVSSNGYVHYYFPGGKRISAHRLVARAFLGNPPENKLFVCHRDNNKQNNHYSNLYWGTPAENTNDRIRHGTYLDGDRSPRRKLNSKQVRKILASDLSSYALAEKFGVSYFTVRLIRRRDIWKSIDVHRKPL